MATYSEMLAENNPTSQSYSLNANIANSILPTEDFRKNITRSSNPYVTSGQRFQGGILVGVGDIELAGARQRIGLSENKNVESVQKQITESEKGIISKTEFSKDLEFTGYRAGEVERYFDVDTATVAQVFQIKKPKGFRNSGARDRWHKRRREAQSLLDKRYKQYVDNFKNKIKTRTKSTKKRKLKV